MLDPELEAAGLVMMVQLRKEMDKILLEAGMTPEEIQAAVEKAISSIRIDGVPIHAAMCSHCDGKGWILS